MKIVYTNILAIVLTALFFSTNLNAQNNVGIGTSTPDSSAILEILSNNKGVLIPRMTAAERMSIPTPANALLVYDTDSLCFYYYIQPSTTWMNLCNAYTETDPKVGSLTSNKVPNWNGTTLEDGSISDDGTSVSISTDASINGLTVGRGAGNVVTNIASGYRALYSNTTGSSNLASGYQALTSNTSGWANAASGNQSLLSNTTGWGNVGNGFKALYNNTTGYLNVASGYHALFNNSMGYINIASGHAALWSNTTGSGNIASGKEALYLNVSGSDNIAIGTKAGYFETGSDKLYIENSNSTTPLIYGDFAADELTVNGDLDINGNLRVQDLTLDNTNDSILVASGDGTIAYRDAASLIVETDPKVGSLTSNKVPNWNGTALEDGSITDDGISVSISTDLMINGHTFGRGAGDIPSNLASGYNALSSNTTGVLNLASGYSALSSNTIGYWNVAIGYDALRNNTMGNTNVAVGNNALKTNTTGYDNLASGTGALVYNTTGYKNVASGNSALYSNTTGSFNSAFGENAGTSNSTGSRNVFLGYNAGYSETGSDKLYIESSSSTTPLIYGDFAADFVGINTTSSVGSAQFVVGNTNTGYGGMYINSIGAPGARTPFYGYAVGGAPKAWTEFNEASNKWHLVTLSFPRITADGTGKIGIATVSPTQTLDVNGKLRVRDVTLDNTTDRVLVASGDGTVAYRDASSLSSSSCGLAIGDTYQGGIIFYLDASGCHGLVCTSSDQSAGIQWYNGVNVVTGAVYGGVKAGQSNTKLITDVQGAGSYAGQLCNDLTRYSNVGLFDDWYLPSLFELNLMNYNIGQGNALGLGNIGNFVNGFYWSSKEVTDTHAMVQDFTTGNQLSIQKLTLTPNVRAVRAF